MSTACRSRFSGFLLILFLSSAARAEFFVGPGATGSSFLKIPVSARASGMSGAFTAVSGDPAALEYNPAGLSEIYRLDLNATMIRHLEESKIQSFSLGYPLSFKKSANLNDGFFGPDSNKLFLGIQYRSFQAEDTARDEDGIDLGDFSIKDQMIQLGLAYSPFERLSLGVAAKSISSKIAGEVMSNHAVDGGLLWKLSANLTAGASILNFGPDQGYVSGKDPLPTTLRTGLAFQSKRMLFTTDFFTGRDKITQEALGLELKPNSILKIRGGLLNNDTDLNFSGGIGVMFSPNFNKPNSPEREKKKNKKILDELNVPEYNSVYQEYGSRTRPVKPMDFGIDYSIQTHQDLDATHTVTLKILY